MQVTTLKQRIAYSLGHMQNDLYGAMWFSYSLGFFQLVTNDPLLSGALILTGQLVDALATPVAGHFLDRTTNKKLWHFFGTFVTSGSFSLLFSYCSICMGQTIWLGLYYSMAVVALQCGWAFVQIAHLSLLPELSPSPRERAQLTAYRYSASMFSNIILYLITWYYFYGTVGGETSLLTVDDNTRFFGIALTITALGLFFTGIFYTLIPPATSRFLPIPNQEPEKDRSSKMKICCSRGIYMVAAVYTSSRLFLNITMEYLLLYINETVISNKEAIATIPLIMFVSSAITSIFYNYGLSNKGNHKFTYLMGWLSCISGCIIIFVRQNRSDIIYDIGCAAALFGTGSAMTLVVSLSLAANLAQKGTEAFIYSSVTFADKAINGIAVVLIEYLRCERPELCSMYYRNVLVYLNGLILSIGLVFVIITPGGITTMRTI